MLQTVAIPRFKKGLFQAKKSKGQLIDYKLQSVQVNLVRKIFMVTKSGLSLFHVTDTVSFKTQVVFQKNLQLDFFYRPHVQGVSFPNHTPHVKRLPIISVGLEGQNQAWSTRLELIELVMNQSGNSCSQCTALKIMRHSK